MAPPDPADVIELRGLRVLARHGCLPEEREREQPFEVDLDVHVDLSVPGRSDDLDDTLDYGAVVAAAVVAAGPPSKLLEHVAERVAQAVLADSRVTAVTVAIRKLRPPVPADLATAGVRITRRRPA
ncbi:MAG TPA: dihydroneopterin aldolase [Acidimicrobiales bacterium]|nr:dihydroneopterin aldolase [Acidimicrobiales bacterium]